MSRLFLFSKGSDFVSEKRKDSKGRVLKTGESQRKDGLYQYRYKDITGERRTIYAGDLKELRQKEKELEQSLQKGVSYFAGNIPLSELLDRVFAVKQRWRDSTRTTMIRYLAIIKQKRIYQMPINKIKMMDCKALCVELHNQGYSFGTISSIHALLKIAFAMACEDDLLAKNPCGFPVKSIIDDDTPKVVALTDQQIQEFKQFLKGDTYGQRWSDITEILLGTGMRIGEFGALTVDDIDFENNVIHIRKQIQRLVGRVVITTTKSKNGIRDIPMTPTVRRSVRNLINARQKKQVDYMIDGYVGFLCITRNGRPRTGPEYADSLRLLVNRYNETAIHRIDRCTPHVFRHTFCTRCIAAGMDIKTVQYLMGHSDASTTLNVYTDAMQDNVAANIKMLEYGTF